MDEYGLEMLDDNDAVLELDAAATAKQRDVQASDDAWRMLEQHANDQLVKIEHEQSIADMWAMNDALTRSDGELGI